eukprot:COSAG06_NODE_1107_length_10634_cov_44.531903_10_plen_86_part_00
MLRSIRKEQGHGTLRIYRSVNHPPHPLTNTPNAPTYYIIGACTYLVVCAPIGGWSRTILVSCLADWLHCIVLHRRCCRRCSRLWL